MREIERAFAIAMAVQSGVDVDAAPTMAANALRVAEPVSVDPNGWVSPNEMTGEQTGGKGSVGGVARAGRIHTFGVKRRVRGTGAAYGLAAAPKEDALLRALFGAREIDATPGAEYATYYGADVDEALLTVIAQSYKKQFKALNVVPRSASLEVNAGGIFMLSAELVGVGLPPTQQLLQAPTLDTVKPPVLKGATFTLNGVSLKLIKFLLNFGIELSDPILDATAGDAWSGHVITDRKPTGSITVNIEDIAEFDPFALHAAATEIPLMLQGGSSDYNRIRLEADKLEITSVKPISRGGVGAYELGYKINRATSPSVKDPMLSFIK